MALIRWTVVPLLIALSLNTGCKKTEEQAAPPQINTESATAPAEVQLTAGPGQHLVTLNVEGMTCGGCAQAITAKLGKTPGVHQVRVSHTEKTAIAIVDDAGPSDAVLAEVITGLGYTAQPAAATAPAETPPASEPAA